MTGPRVVAPNELIEAIDILAAEDLRASPIAGGATWLLRSTRGMALPATLVSLAAIPSLATVTVADDGSLVIGAMARLSDLERSPLVADHAPGLLEAVAAVGTPRIRNQATIGGNLADADPGADPPPMLMALGAHLRLAGPNGVREVAVGPYVAGAVARGRGEVIRSVVIPPQTRSSRVAYWSLRSVTGRAVEHVAAAIRLQADSGETVSDALVVVATGDSPPQRAHAAESYLRGRRPAESEIAEAGALAAAERFAGLDARAADASERTALVAVAVRRALRVGCARLWAARGASDVAAE